MTREQLLAQIRQKRSFLCVGLDTDLKKVPEHILRHPNPMLAFNKAIIDATAPYCVAYKPNVAFYECSGVAGWEALKATVEYIRQNYPDIFIIADAKRGDIGNTSKMYAKAFFEDMDVDAVTVAPYMGVDSVSPFLEYEGKWVILLALTSNKGSEDFQHFTDSKGLELYQKVILESEKWAGEDRMMYVVGATRGRMFEDVRLVAPRNFLLVPGVGAQGGSLQDVCDYGFNEQCGLLVNSSRGIIYASNGTDFAEAAAREAAALRDVMDCELRKRNL